MKDFLLKKVRLSYYFVGAFILSLIAVILLPKLKFEGGALTLFSVNSFLYGFYISPILNGQKARIEELHKIVRSEANALFAMALVVAKLATKERNKIHSMLIDYTDHAMRHKWPAGGEEKYEAMINFCVNYEGKNQAEIDKLLDKLIANQQNRTNYSMQLNNRVYSNEWIVTIILFSITMSFILLLNAGVGVVFNVLAALLCTGLSMLLIILVKMSTLTHKKAKQIWDPYKKLIDTRFYRID